jgi:hypothetical protein
MEIWGGFGRGIGEAQTFEAGMCRGPASLYRSLPSSIEAYVRSHLPTPEEP